jgi:hypothetical protein
MMGLFPTITISSLQQPSLGMLSYSYSLITSVIFFILTGFDNSVLFYFVKFGKLGLTDIDLSIDSCEFE